MEYGMPNWVMRIVGSVGSASEPFTIRVKDWGVSGPGTGYPEGVRPRNTAQVILFKGDPAEDFGSSPSRFVRWIKLPDTYGSGASATSQASPPCSHAIGTDGIANPMRFESNVVGKENRDYWFEYVGDWKSHLQSGGTFVRGTELIQFGGINDTSPNHSHIVRLATGTALAADTIKLRDRSTVTGPGTWGNLSAEHIASYSAVGTLPTCESAIALTSWNGQMVTWRFLTSDNRFYQCYLNTTPNPDEWQWREVPTARNSTVTNTRVSGSVAISTDIKDTTISNVEFTGTARAIVTLGANSNVILADLCVPSGSTMTRADETATATLDGGAVTFTANSYTFGALADCSITADGRPDPPSGGSVQ
jgi:hypothetical protein